MSNEIQSKLCSRCDVESEHYINNISTLGEVVLCNDCCGDFILFATSVGLIKPSDWTEYATNTRKT